MLADDCASDAPKWSFWSGKLGWSSFAQSSWTWLDALHQQAKTLGQPQTDDLDVGGWVYEITMDPKMNNPDCPEACGYQVAKHVNSNRNMRYIMKAY